MQIEQPNPVRVPLWRRGWVRGLVLAVLVILVLMQFVRFFVPVLALDNPPVTHEVPWSSPEVERLFTNACADCHSNETVYPFYSYIAPPGWLVAYDIHRGRDDFNISTNHRIEAYEMIEKIESGEMPPWNYVLLHPEASLSDAEKETLLDGIIATFEDGERDNSGRGRGRGRGGEDGDDPSD